MNNYRWNPEIGVPENMPPITSNNESQALKQLSWPQKNVGNEVETRPVIDFQLIDNSTLEQAEEEEIVKKQIRGKSRDACIVQRQIVF